MTEQVFEDARKDEDTFVLWLSFNLQLRGLGT